MESASIEKTNSSIKQNSFFKKIIRPLALSIKTMVKKIKRKLSPYNANYYYGITAEGYETERIEKEWWQKENKVVEEILKFIPKGLSVLDVPFGTGRFLPLYDAHQMKVTGLDISYAMLETAKNLRKDLAEKCKLDVGNATKLPYEDNYFDLVLSFRFLDGIITFKEEKQAIAEFVRVSRKYLILELYSVPGGDDLNLLVKNLQENQPVMGRMSEIERKKWLESFGIKIIKITPVALEEKLHSVVYLCEKVGNE